MMRLAGFGLVIAAAVLVVGANGEDILSKGVKVDWENAVTKEQLENGLFVNPPFATSRVIRGRVVKRITKAPYVGSVYHVIGNSWGFVCTAVVVDTYIMMTAAHCLEDTFGADIGVCVSGEEITEGRCVKASRWKIPKKYEGTDFDQVRPHTHDIALVRTEMKLVQRGSKAKVIAVDLDPNGLTESVAAPGFLYGFGRTTGRGETLDGKLRVLDVEWQKWDLCEPDLDVVVTNNFLCVDGNYDGSLGGSCFGDSGGPLVWSSNNSQDPDTHVLVGVSSFVYLKRTGFCNIRKPSGYARIGSVSQSKWLLNTMQKLGGNFTLYEP